MNETVLREKLKEIDALRSKAADYDAMRSRWSGYDEEIVESVTVKRRWLRNKRVASEAVMGSEEVRAFRDWLMLRAGQMRLQADELSSELEGGAR